MSWPGFVSQEQIELEVENRRLHHLLTVARELNETLAAYATRLEARVAELAAEIETLKARH
jgi:hypothetical protein